MIKKRSWIASFPMSQRLNYFAVFSSFLLRYATLKLLFDERHLICLFIASMCSMNTGKANCDTLTNESMWYSRCVQI